MQRHDTDHVGFGTLWWPGGDRRHQHSDGARPPQGDHRPSRFSRVRCDYRRLAWSFPSSRSARLGFALWSVEGRRSRDAGRRPGFPRSGHRASSTNRDLRCRSSPWFGPYIESKANRRAPPHYQKDGARDHCRRSSSCISGRRSPVNRRGAPGHHHRHRAAGSRSGGALDLRFRCGRRCLSGVRIQPPRRSVRGSRVDLSTTDAFNRRRRSPGCARWTTADASAVDQNESCPRHRIAAFHPGLSFLGRCWRLFQHGGDAAVDGRLVGCHRARRAVRNHV